MILYVLGGISLLTAIFLILSRKNNKKVKSYVLKPIASGFFVALGIAAQITGERTNIIGIIIIVGLCFGFVGDFLLQFKHHKEGMFKKMIVLGMASFLVGHLLYSAASVLLYGITVYPFIFAAIAVVGMYCNLKRYDMEGMAKSKIFGLIYYFFLAFMASQAVTSAIIFHTAQSIIFAIGAVLFFISDNILLEIYFGEKSTLLSTLNLMTYYLAQVLIAYSICLL